jgi:hypothetical protein
VSSVGSNRSSGSRSMIPGQTAAAAGPTPNLGAGRGQVPGLGLVTTNLSNSAPPIGGVPGLFGITRDQYNALQQQWQQQWAFNLGMQMGRSHRW